jgi:hypothetical protein
MFQSRLEALSDTLNTLNGAIEGISTEILEDAAFLPSDTSRDTEYHLEQKIGKKVAALNLSPAEAEFIKANILDELKDPYKQIRLEQ